MGELIMMVEDLALTLWLQHWVCFQGIAGELVLVVLVLDI